MFTIFDGKFVVGMTDYVVYYEIRKISVGKFALLMPIVEALWKQHLKNIFRSGLSLWD